jgi:hypothetical protein
MYRNKPQVNGWSIKLFVRFAQYLLRWYKRSSVISKILFVTISAKLETWWTNRTTFPKHFVSYWYSHKVCSTLLTTWFFNLANCSTNLPTCLSNRANRSTNLTTCWSNRANCSTNRDSRFTEQILWWACPVLWFAYQVESRSFQI